MADMEYDELISRLDEQLQSVKCEIWRKVHISPTREVALFATRIKWNLVRVPVHLCVDYMAGPKPDDFDALLEESLAYSKRAFAARAWRRFILSSFAIIPCLVCDIAYPETISFVRNRHRILKFHRKHWFHGLVFYPVLYCLSTNETYYWTGFEYVGSAVWPYARKFIEESIVAATTTNTQNSNRRQSSPELYDEGG